MLLAFAWNEERTVGKDSHEDGGHQAERYQNILARRQDWTLAAIIQL
jgi:hypothetical protein